MLRHRTVALWCCRPAQSLTARSSLPGSRRWRCCERWRVTRESDPPYDVLRVSPLDSHGELFKQLPFILRAQGWILQRFFMYPNWYEDVSGHDSAEYLHARPSRLRSTIERRTRSLEKSGRSRTEILGSAAALDTAIWDYERVFGRSWKQGLVEVPYQRAIMQVAGIKTV